MKKSLIQVDHIANGWLIRAEIDSYIALFVAKTPEESRDIVSQIQVGAFAHLFNDDPTVDPFASLRRQ